jgi:replication factor C subunit 3/5
VEINTVSSNYHIELNPSDAGNQDTFVVQEFIKEVASHATLDSGSDKKKTFKVIVLTEVEKLTRNAQAALRRTMEKYTSSCRLILCCRSPCQVIDPVRSRCLGIRVASPSQLEIVDVLNKIAAKEALGKVPDALVAKIALYSEGNMRRAIFMLEACRVQQYPFTADQQVQLPDWEVYIHKIAAVCTKEQSPKKLIEVS